MRTSTWTLLVPPTRWKRLVDQHAQDLALRLARHVGDFVENSVPPWASSSAPTLRAAVPFVALHAEQLRLPCARA